MDRSNWSRHRIHHRHDRSGPYDEEWFELSALVAAVLLTALFMGYEGKVTRAIQLARPATVALVFTLLELGALSAARFWLEAQGMIVTA